ncbi:flagellar biosynthesis protein FlgA [Galactobacter valiniphilus]|uniref:Flagellar biosynthesis protein FlgA n=1 Tax=Galactobacter valiniphilus TaxID=2676122 RepID=A0A399JAF5_9MICC|nr:flagellar biosynthesis protein FlgA [Galactobacter valiniphilus]RII42561.1 flagellar biosynthesis protein FlgA [Galactobacter valiniphilus]
MEAGQQPTRRRFSRAGVKDPRFVIGVVLVLASVLGVVALVQSFDKTQAVYAAARDLGAGSELTREDLVVLNVRLGDSAGAYLSAASEPPAGTRVLAAVRQGELLPLRALGPAGDERRPMRLDLDGGAPAGVWVGSHVDVFVTEVKDGATAAPRVALRSLEVTAISTSEAGLAGNSRTVLEVLVPPAEVATLVAARGAERVDVVAGSPPQLGQASGVAP